MKGFTPAIVMEMDYVETVKQLVASGVGFAILPVTTVERELKQGLLLGLPIADIPNLRREVTFIYTKRSAYAIEVQVLSKILRQFYPPNPA